VGPVGAADASDDAVDLLADVLDEVPVPEVERLESTDDETSREQMCAAAAFRYGPSGRSVSAG